MINLNNKYIGTIVITFFTILIITCSLFVANTVNPQNFLVDASAFVSAMSGLTTMFIALLLYNKFGIDSTLLIKNFESVNKLIVSLQDMRLTIIAPDRTQFFLNLYAPWSLDEMEDLWNNINNQELRDLPLAFGNSYFEGIKKIEQLIRDIYMPSKIRDKLKPFSAHGVGKVENEKCLNVEISGSESKDTKMLQEGEFGFILAPKFLPTTTLDEYISLWRDLHQSIKKWMKEHSNLPIDINIHQDLSPWK